jgi:hypothetical protein
VKNDLFGTGNEDEHENKSGLSQEDIREILNMARSIQKANLVNLLEK